MPGFSARSSRTSVQNWRRESGSTPVVGSSRISRSGLCTRAQHRLSFCFMPPESLPAARSAKGARPVESIRRSMCCLRWCLFRPNRRAWKSMFSYTESVGQRFLPKPCGIKAMRGSSDSRSALCATLCPSTRTSPLWGVRTPAISESRVDLPTPSGPIKPTVALRPMAIDTPRKACTLP